MRVSRYTLLALAMWLVLLVHFLTQDADAFFLSIVLTPVVGVLVWASIRSRHVVLSIFMVMALVSHAVAPPFFFMTREFYSYGGGFGAVKDFSFGVAEFLRIYWLVLLYLAFVVIFSVQLNAWVRRRVQSVVGPLRAPAFPPPSRYAVWFEWALAIFIVLIAIPMSLYMHSVRVGISGIIAPVLPYRMTGIMYYFRMFVVPFVLATGYMMTRRGAVITALIVVYAFVAGFAGSSRYLAMMAVGPITLFALIERRHTKALVLSLAAAALFLLVTASREHVYVEEMTLSELIRRSVFVSAYSSFAPFDAIGGIANRLWGPQDIVLAYQYTVPDGLVAFFKYFTNQVVVEDLTYEFYGMVFTEAEAGFGVGLGFIPWMIVLSSRSVPVLILLALVTACLLTASEWVVGEYRRRGGVWRIVAPPMAFLFVNLIYASTMNWWYQAMLLAAIPPILWDLLRAGASRRMPRVRDSVPTRPYGPHPL